MGFQVQKSRAFPWALAVALALCGQGYAEVRRALSPLPVAVAQRPENFPETAQLYKDYFAERDERLTLEFLERCRLLEARGEFDEGARDNEAFLSYSQAMSVEAQQGLADQVLRMRIDGAVKKYFEAPNRAVEFKKASQTARKLQNYTVKLAPAQPVATKIQESPAELRFGYDIATDSTRIEYLANRIAAGFYHDAFLSTLTNGIRRAAPVLRLRVQGEAAFSDAGISWYLGAQPQLELSLAQKPSPRIKTEVFSRISGVATSSEEVAFRITYDF